MQILEANERSEEENLFLDFLIDNFAAGECLSIPELLIFEEENDKEGLELYIGGRFPNLSSTKFQAYLKKKGEKGSSVSGVVKEAGGDVAYSSAQPPPSPKRKRTESEKSLELISEGDHGATAKSYPGDMVLTRRTGVEGMGKFIQIVASRLMCVGRATELLGSEQQAMADKISGLEFFLKEKDEVVISVTLKMKEKEDEVCRLQEQIRLLQAEIKDNDKTKGEMTSRLAELEEEKMDMFVAGFDRAISQVTLFLPNFNVEKLNVTKIVVNGELVDDEAGEGHAENILPTL
ncbi:uncharacterized protein DS421_16g536040 [Arachis hypogaea]|nr:uncharacterized protein DS421_16g536040 [Arachis hypogaea]